MTPLPDTGPSGARRRVRRTRHHRVREGPQGLGVSAADRSWWTISSNVFMLAAAIATIQDASSSLWIVYLAASVGFSVLATLSTNKKEK